MVVHASAVKSPPVCTGRSFVRLLGSFFCLFVVALGAGLGATAAYILVNYEYIGEVFGREVFFGAIYTLLACGAFAVMTGLLGFYDFTHENRFTAILTATGLILLSIILLITGIITYVYPRGMQHLLLNAMVSTLPNYGLISSTTRAWDRMQSYLRCCAINNLGWTDYKNTTWYLRINQNVYETDSLLQMTSPYYTAVPASCCATLIDPLTGHTTETYRNLDRCQRWQYGPPQLQSGAHNDALYYRGCFPVLADYMLLHTRHTFGLSLGLIAVMVCSCCCYVMIVLIYFQIATFILLIVTKLLRTQRPKKS